jgi:hypothetical protein
MDVCADKLKENKNQPAAGVASQAQAAGKSAAQFVDNRPEAVAQRKIQAIANNYTAAMYLKVNQKMADNQAQMQQASLPKVMADHSSPAKQQSIQKKENNTGLPDDLKSGIENLSGYSMDDVKVHYDSDKPAQMFAHAYAQGADIHIASGQEKYLPHEAWHVVQQKQGRVKPMIQLKGKLNVNDSPGLEKEADAMATEAPNTKTRSANVLLQKPLAQNSLIQPKWAGLELETRIPIYENGERKDNIDAYINRPSYQHTNVVPSITEASLGRGFEIHVDNSFSAQKRAISVVHTNTIANDNDDGPKIMEIVTPPRQSPDENKGDLVIVKRFLSNFDKQAAINADGWNIGWPTATAPYRKLNGEEVSADVLNEALAMDVKHTNRYEYDSQVTYQNDIETLGSWEDRDAKAGPDSKESPIVKINALKPTLADAILRSAPATNQSDAYKLAIIAAKMLSDTLGFLDGGPRGGTIKNAVGTLIRSDLRSLHVYLNTGVGENRAEICEGIAKDFFTIASSVLPETLAIAGSPAKLLTPQSNEGEVSHVNARIKKTVKPKGRNNDKTVDREQVLEWWAAEVFRMLEGTDSSPDAVTGPLRGERELLELARDKKIEPMVVYEVRGGWSGDLNKGYDKSIKEMMTRHQEHQFENPVKTAGNDTTETGGSNTGGEEKRTTRN